MLSITYSEVCASIQTGLPVLFAGIAATKLPTLNNHGQAKVNAFKGYPARLQARVKKINKFWPIAKRFYLGIEAGHILTHAVDPRATRI